MVVKITVKGLEEAKRFLDNKAKEIENKGKAALTMASLHMQNEVKLSIAGFKSEPTSVDTGRFLNSVDINIGKIDAIIFSDIPYANHLEYGTTRIKPRSHFRNSKARNQDKVIEIIEKEIKSWKMD